MPGRATSSTFRHGMAQNTQSATASRAGVPGTANDEPVAPPLFTQPPRREYITDAKRVGEAQKRLNELGKR